MYQWIYYNGGWPPAVLTPAGTQFPQGQDYQVCAAADTLIGQPAPCYLYPHSYGNQTRTWDFSISGS